MNVSPSISVVIPCYNGAPFLQETLESALNQTYPPLEVIVVDDGSTDNSAAIAEAFGPPVRVIRQKNQGESVARNRGIDEAQGDWIALLDADDLWLPEKLERQLEALSEAPDDVVCCYTHFFYLHPDGTTELPPPRPRLDETEDFPVQMLVDWCFLPSTALIKRTIAKAHPFPENVQANEDQIFAVECRFQGPFTLIDHPLCYYRRFPGQQTAKAQHIIEAVFAKLNWAKENPKYYDAGQLQRLEEELFAGFARSHDQWYWQRNNKAVKAVRAAWPAHLTRPKSLDWTLYPEWLTKTKDSLDQLLTFR